LEVIGVTGEYVVGGEKMNPVVGIDVAKEESEVQAFLEKGKPYGKKQSSHLFLLQLTEFSLIKSSNMRRISSKQKSGVNLDG
jgi:hypothetical protein